MIYLTYKQKKLIEFLNNYRSNKKLDIKTEFEDKEELDLYIKENYDDAKHSQATSRANCFGYSNTSAGRNARSSAYGRYMHTGKCIVYKDKEQYDEAKAKEKDWINTWKSGGDSNE